MFEEAKNLFKKAKKFDDENQTAKRNAPLWFVILNDGMPIFTIIAYVLLGVLGGMWHPGWLVFFLIPLYYTLVEAIKHKNAYFFAFPVLAIAVFLLVGFIGEIIGTKLWHPAWVALISIPVYYLVVGIIRKGNLMTIVDVTVPICVVAVFLALGFTIGEWEKIWAVFLAIPLYYSIRASVAKYNRRNNAKQSSPEDFVRRVIKEDNDDDVIIK